MRRSSRGSLKRGRLCMTQIDSTAVTGWTSPELVRLGRISDVAGANGSTSQCNSAGNNCKS